MPEEFPAGYAELLPILTNRLDAVPGSEEEKAAALQQRAFREDFLATHSLSNYIRLISTVNKDIVDMKLVTVEDLA